LSWNKKSDKEKGEQRATGKHPKQKGSRNKTLNRPKSTVRRGGRSLRAGRERRNPLIYYPEPMKNRTGGTGKMEKKKKKRTFRDKKEFDKSIPSAG